MRRKDREILDRNNIINIIAKCTHCRVGFNDGGEVYILPINFGEVIDGEKTTLYFHGAAEGRKYDLAKGSPRVGFEMDCGYELQTAEMPCGYSAKFESIIGNGVFSIVEDFEEKVVGLTAVMNHCDGRKEWKFNEAMVNAVCVYKLEVENMSCKEHL